MAHPELETFPALIRKPKTLQPPFLKPMLQMGPRTFDGRSQIGAPDAGYWTLRIAVDVSLLAEQLEWMGFVTAIQGGLNPFVCPIFGERWVPKPATGAINVTLRTALNEGATTASFTTTNVGPLKRGMFFSINDRLHQIIRAPNVVSGARSDVVFLPPAREGALINAAVEFENPTFIARPTNPAAGPLDLTRNWQGEGALELEEDFYGLGV
ncbi:hypothetical protein [Methylopila sp. 73B]|uniref:hypothetical protein n=1 Tax=Methylopila sp. 73B TaxID=1120792 RepID=UPI00036ACB3B|nr:hypothetical protein [Methylopila sp. 73B]